MGVKSKICGELKQYKKLLDHSFHYLHNHCTSAFEGHSSFSKDLLKLVTVFYIQLICIALIKQSHFVFSDEELAAVEHIHRL